MTDTTTTPHLTRDETCALADSLDWEVEADGRVVQAWRNRARVTIFFPDRNCWTGPAEIVKVSYKLTDGTWNEVELPEPDVQWALTEMGTEVLPPFTEWALEHGLPYKAPATGAVRLRWHYATGTGEPGDWENVPAEWGEFDGWRSRAAR